ncbi:GNAT family N-acetyltransferase [Pelagibius sp.]|uniref:GNAT family N-acetyltransferase n=1 Tax=Pelagibius sp. TaxID=1931238 RepID=UPI002608E823|nr:GNAT family N-acetyltransferase [Pelagibius sp.]
MHQDDSAAAFEPAPPEERDQIERLFRRAFAAYVGRLGRVQSDDAYDWLEAAIERGDVFVARQAGALVGAVATSHREGDLYIDQVAVDPERQGAGIGSWLLDSTERVARSRRTKALCLHTAEMMDDLLRLYRRHGFEEVRRGLPDHGKDAHVRVFMRKAL